MKKKEQIKALQATVEEQEAQLSQSDFVIDELKKQLGFHKETIAEKDKEIRLLKTINAEGEDHPKIKVLLSIIKDRESQIASCNLHINDLTRSIVKYGPEPANYREELKKLKDENEELKAKLKNQETLEAIANTRLVDLNNLEAELKMEKANVDSYRTILDEIRCIADAYIKMH